MKGTVKGALTIAILAAFFALPCSLNAQTKAPEKPFSLSTSDIEFLTGKCNIERADVDVIPSLDSKARTSQASARDLLASLIAKRDCNLLQGFKNSRAYYKGLSVDKPIPLPPVGWDAAYLTKQEFEHYLYIMDNAPW